MGLFMDMCFTGMLLIEHQILKQQEKLKRSYAISGKATDGIGEFSKYG